MLKTKKQMLEEIAHLNASLKGSHSLWEDLAKECDALKAENAKLKAELDASISANITVGAIRQSAEEYRDEFIIPTKEKGWEILR